MYFPHSKYRLKRALILLNTLQKLQDAIDEKLDREALHQQEAHRKLADFRSNSGSRLAIDQLSDEECKKLFRFTYQEMLCIIDELELGTTLNFFHGTNNSINVSSIEGLAILLRRLVHPARLADLELIFNHDKSDISRIFNAMIELLYEKFGNSLEFDVVQFQQSNLQRFSKSILETGTQIDDCVGFVNETFLKCSRPAENHDLIYAEEYGAHGFKFQVIVTPDGIASGIFGPIVGRKSATDVYNASCVEEKASRLFGFPEENGPLYHFVGDEAYVSSVITLCPFNENSLDPAQQEGNTRLSFAKDVVDDEFTHLSTLFPFLDYAPGMRLGLSPIAKYYIVAMFLKNLHTCVNGGNETSRKFGVPPPTLHDYINGLKSNDQQNTA